jgi:hypothetical protein
MVRLLLTGKSTLTNAPKIRLDVDPSRKSG